MEKELEGGSQKYFAKVRNANCPAKLKKLTLKSW